MGWWSWWCAISAGSSWGRGPGAGLRGVAAEALRRAPKVPLVDWVEVRFLVPFPEVGRVHGLLKARGLAAKEGYGPEGVLFALRLPEGEREAFLRALLDLTRGQARVENP